MKKVILLLFVLCVFSLTACGKKEEDKQTETQTETQTEVTTPEETTPEATTPEETTPEATTPEETTPEGEKVMSHEEYMAAEKDAEVLIEAYIQGKQLYDEEKKAASIYLQDDNGGYFVYGLPCTSEEYTTKLAVGNKIRVKGTKAIWSNEHEIMGQSEGAEATWTLLEGTKTYEATDISDKLASADLINLQNAVVKFTGLTVLPQTDKDGNETAFLYKWNGAGQQGDDVYVKVTNGTDTFSFVIESDLTNKDTEVYKAAEALQVGQKLDLEGFLYWYNGLQPHITKIAQSTAKSSVMTHQEYMDAAVDAEVTIVAYIQGKQLYDEKEKGASIYLQDEFGGYFAYNLPCTKEEYNTKLVLGAKIKITGTKAIWSNEHEIMGQSAGAEATWEILEGSKIYKSTNINAVLGAKDLINSQNMFVNINDLTVVAQKNAQNEDVAFLYQWNGAGQQGDDVYVKVTDGTNTFSFVIESNLNDKDSKVYKAAEALQIGQKLNVEGFLYWYNGLQPHITSIEVVVPSLLEVSFKGAVKTNSYEAKEFTVNEKAFSATMMYSDGKDIIRVGAKKNLPVLDAKFGFAAETTGALLEAKFETENVEELVLNVTKVYKNTQISVFFQAAGSQEVAKVFEKNYEAEVKDAFELSAKLEAAANGHFIVVVTGVQPRVELASYILK